jgi:protein SCO1/2
MLHFAAMKHGTEVSDAAPAPRRPLRVYYLVWIVLALALLLDLGLGWWLYEYRPAPSPPDPPGVQSFARPDPAPAFSLTDQNGQAFTTDRLRGKWTVMLFGYTHCPDFCPTTLTALNSFYGRLNAEDPGFAADTQVVFVSVDPFRDTVPVLADYIRHFNPAFIAATGTPAELQHLTRPLGASYDYADPASGRPLGDLTRPPSQDYTVDHAAGLYLFDARARNVAWILPPHTPERLYSVYQLLRKRYE